MRAQIRLAGNTSSQPMAYLTRNRSVAAQQSRFTITFHREAIASRISKGIDERGGNFFIHFARRAWIQRGEEEKERNRRLSARREEGCEWARSTRAARTADYVNYEKPEGETRPTSFPRNESRLLARGRCLEYAETKTAHFLGGVGEGRGGADEKRKIGSR